MTTKKMKEILAYEWEGKKVYTPNYEANCSICDGYIGEDDFYFYGNKQKMCQTCFEEIDDWLQE